MHAIFIKPMSTLNALSREQTAKEEVLIKEVIHTTKVTYCCSMKQSVIFCFFHITVSCVQGV